MPTTTHKLTPEGLEKLKVELAELKTVTRPTTVKRLAAARELGDLSENADYHDAREQLAFIEGRIEELGAMIQYADVVSSKSGAAGTIHMGSTVTVQMKGKSGTTQYTIVGSNESDPAAGKISSESPVGSALLDHKAGDTVTVYAPSGTQELVIKSVA